MNFYHEKIPYEILQRADEGTKARLKSMFEDRVGGGTDYVIGTDGSKTTPSTTKIDVIEDAQLNFLSSEKTSHYTYSKDYDATSDSSHRVDIRLTEKTVGIGADCIVLELQGFGDTKLSMEDLKEAVRLIEKNGAKHDYC